MLHAYYRIFILLLVLVTAPIMVYPQAKPDKDPFAKVDHAKVEAAIKKGAEYLLARSQPLSTITYGPSDAPTQEQFETAELVLYTLIYAGVDRNSPEFKGFLEHILSKKLERTYNVSLMAMALQALDFSKYQDTIAECAQFLVDNQCRNGQWSYGEPVPPYMPHVPKPTSVASGRDSEKPNVTKMLKVIQIKRRKEGPSNGDNSNTQYGCLGLRACMESKIIIPDEVFARTKKWLESSQNADGGWGYNGANLPQATDSYGSMTVGALGGLIICDFYLNKMKDTKNVTNNRRIQKGLDWLINNFTVQGNPKVPGDLSRRMLYYYLYALERLGVFLEAEKFGTHEWYPPGVEYLLAIQKENGRWLDEGTLKWPEADTCFAILFLKRATPPLVRIITK